MLNFSEGRKRFDTMKMDYGAGGHADDGNCRLVRFFGICLGVLVVAYAVLAFRLFVEREASGPVAVPLISLRMLLGAAAVLVVVYPAWLARPLERQIELMGRLFEDGFANLSTRRRSTSPPRWPTI